MSSNVYTSDVTVDTASKGQLKESIRLREQRLSTDLDELVGRIHPKALKAKAQAAARGVIVNKDGSLKTERLALAGGLVLGAAALVSITVVRKRRG